MEARRVSNEYVYIANDDWPAPPEKRKGIHIKQWESKTIDGVRRSVGEINELTDPARTPWKVVLQKKKDTDEAIGEAFNDAQHDTGGILTPGQLQCMCIIVAIFEKDADTKWSRAWLTHVSTEYAPEVNQMVGKLTEANRARAFVAIGGQKGSLGAMQTISNAFGGTEVPDRRRRLNLAGQQRQRPLEPQPPVEPQPPTTPTTPYPHLVSEPVTVVIYAGGKDGEPFGFGMNKDGLVGEVTGSLR